MALRHFDRWRPERTESRLDFQFYEPDLAGLERVLGESHAFTARFREEHGFSPHAWIQYFVRGPERSRKPFGLYSGGPGVSFSFDPVVSDPIDPRWQQFAGDYNQAAIHELGGRTPSNRRLEVAPTVTCVPRDIGRGHFSPGRATRGIPCRLRSATAATRLRIDRIIPDGMAGTASRLLEFVRHGFRPCRTRRPRRGAVDSRAG